MHADRHGDVVMETNQRRGELMGGCVCSDCNTATKKKRKGNGKQAERLIIARLQIADKMLSVCLSLLHEN